jgi:hypothetical protein
MRSTNLRLVRAIFLVAGAAACVARPIVAQRQAPDYSQLFEKTEDSRARRS